METASNKTNVTVEATVKAPVDKVWKFWTEPQHITQWNNASDDWHSPKAENDVRTNGKFNIRMEAKDGSFGFDFAGDYNEVKPLEQINYTLGDGRRVWITFTSEGDETRVSETFEAETQNPIDMQRDGWQAIMNNFKTYAESH